jgi:hypothetical protein
MWEGEGAKFESSGYYFHLEPPNIMLGVGIHTFSKTLLKAYREAVVDPVAGPALVKAVINWAASITSACRSDISPSPQMPS